MENPMVNYSKIIADTAKNHYNVHDQYKDNTVEQNVEIQRSQSRTFSVGMINVTGELNIGMALRSACLFGAENFYIFGRKKFDRRSTVGAENYINIVQYTYDDPLNADDKMLSDIEKLRDKHFPILCEQGGCDLNLINWGRSEDCVDCPTPLFLFGSESHGTPKIICDAIEMKVSIPQVGVLRSFNVSAAMNIIVWDYIREAFL